MIGYVIVWKKRTGYEAQSEVWPTRMLAESQMALDAYKNPTIDHQVCEITVSVKELMDAK